MGGSMNVDLSSLSTEARNPATMEIDTADTLSMLRLINTEDHTVADAVERILPDIAAAVDGIVERLSRGGRLFYLGAGTSGRLGVLDAVECPPTYGTDPELVQGLIAGGSSAMFRAKEGAEDDPSLAETELKEKDFSERDVLVGIAASGRTPYVIGALEYAKKLHALTIALSCSGNSAIARIADLALTPVTGPEVIAGSTRLKAGTAQKMVLNMLSTGTMIRLGKVYGNLMVDVRATNQKLEERARRIVMEATGCTEEESVLTLAGARGNAKLAILLLMTGCTPKDGAAALERCKGRLAEAVKEIKQV